MLWRVLEVSSLPPPRGVSLRGCATLVYSLTPWLTLRSFSAFMNKAVGDLCTRVFRNAWFHLYWEA